MENDPGCEWEPRLSLYDTGGTAEFGYTFLTLSACAYYVGDKRFVTMEKCVENNEFE